MKLWLEDNVPTDLYETMETTKGKYTVENQKSHIEKVYGEIFNNRAEAIKEVIKGMETETTK